MTARHIFLGITIFFAGTIIGTGQTLVVQNFPQLETKFHLTTPTPTPTPKKVVPTATPTPTLEPTATPTPRVIAPVRKRVLSTPTPTI